jgi:hypothetical protein
VEYWNIDRHLGLLSFKKLACSYSGIALSNIAPNNIGNRKETDTSARVGDAGEKLALNFLCRGHTGTTCKPILTASPPHPSSQSTADN